jgi:hypothetical protein
MKIQRAFPAIVIVCFILTAMVQAQKTSYDFDRAADFSKFRTYAWKEEAPALERFLDKRIVSAIESQLARSLTRIEASPDLYVRYQVALGVQQGVTGFADGPGPFGWHGGTGAFSAQRTDIPVGALVIDLADAAKGELVWRGVGTSEIDLNAKPDKRDAAIDKVVAKILKNYPPKSGR